MELSSEFIEFLGFLLCTGIEVPPAVATTFFFSFKN